MSPTCAVSRCAPSFDKFCGRITGPRMVTSLVLVFIAVFLKVCVVKVHRRYTGVISEFEMNSPAHHVHGPMPVGVVAGIYNSLVINGQMDTAIHECAVVNLVVLLTR